MTKEELAATMNGREYTEEISDAEARAAKSSGLVVIFGASDDLCEIRGAIDDELGVHNNRTILIAKDGSLLQEIEDDDREILAKHKVLESVQELRDSASKIDITWRNEGNPCWMCETEVPHATFDVMEGKEKFCRGLVLDLTELGCAR